MPEWIYRLGPSRMLSLLVVIGYLVIGFWLQQPKSAKDVLEVLLIAVAGLFFPLACIWFGDEIGDYYGTFPGPAVTTRSPGWMVKIGGWVLLLLPAIAAWFIYKS